MLADPTVVALQVLFLVALLVKNMTIGEPDFADLPERMDRNLKRCDGTLRLRASREQTGATRRPMNRPARCCVRPRWSRQRGGSRRQRSRYDSTGGSCAPERSAGRLSSATTLWVSVPIPSMLALIVSPACR